MIGTPQEYRNQNSHRKYPFVDSATLLASSGVALPLDFILDAFLYVVDNVEQPYLAALDVNAQELTIAGVTTGVLLGKASWTPTSTTAIVYDLSGYNRQMGVLVFGRGITTLGNFGSVTFTPDATAFVPAAFVNIVQTGVQGLVVAGQLMAGNITLVGRGGVRITSSVSTQSIVRVDAVGMPPSPSEDCDTKPPLKVIRIVNKDCPKITGSKLMDGVIAIGSHNFGMEDLCRKPQLPAADGTLPTEKDVCLPTPPPVPWTCPADSTVDVPVSDGQLHIVAPSTIFEVNAVEITVDPAESETLDTSTLQDLTPEGVDKRTQQTLDVGLRPHGKLIIGLKGSPG